MAVGVYGRRSCCRKKVDECKMLAADACGSCTELMGVPKSTLVDRFGKADNVPCYNVGSKAEREQEAAEPAAAAAAAPLPLSPYKSPNRQTRQRIRPTCNENVLSKNSGPDALGFEAGPAASTRGPTQGQPSKLIRDMWRPPPKKSEHAAKIEAVSTLPGRPVHKSAQNKRRRDTEATQAKKKQKRQRREIDYLVIPGSLPLTGFDWTETIKDMSLLSAYGLDTVPQPTRTVIRNNNEPFYAEGTGIQQVEVHFVPKNMRFPDNLLMNEAAVSARTLVAAVFGGDELIGQRDRKYSAPRFHTVSMVDMTVPPNSSTTKNKCISVLYFSQVGRSMWIEYLATDLDYRGKNLGIGTHLLQFMLDIAIVNEGVDDIYLEVGRDKEGKKKHWKAARYVYTKVGFVFMETNRIPGEIAECCKHFGEDYYNVMRFDCKGKAPSRMSARGRRATRSSSSL